MILTETSLTLSAFRKTIGLLTYGIWDALGESLWLGVHEAARQHDVNLLTFEGWVLADNNNNRSAANILYDLVSSEIVDGLIILSGSVGQNLDDNGIRTFISRYSDLPIVSIAAQIGGIPSIVLDNYGGMLLAIEHLIQVHDRKRIAFIRGPAQHPEANERFRAYRDTLKKYRLPQVDRLILQGDFRDESGETAIINLIESGIEFDAIAAANDNMALGAMRALHDKRISIPDEVSVVGFDDILEARSAKPPLTSVSSAFDRYGRQSVDLLLALLSGKTPPPLTPVALNLTIRESCGCMPIALIRAGEPLLSSSKASSPEEIAETTCSAMTEALNNYPGASEHVHLAFQHFQQAIQTGNSLPFLRRLSQIFNQEQLSEEYLAHWHDAISVMRSQLGPVISDGSRLSFAETMWGQTRILIGKSLISKQIDHEARQVHLNQVLRENGYEMATSFDSDTLINAVSWALARLDIQNVYVSLYENPDAPLQQVELFMLYNGSSQDTMGISFRPQQIIPTRLRPKDRQYSFIINALYFDKVQLGIVAYEVGPQTGLVYDTLTRQISQAIHGTNLVQQSRQYSRALELAVSHTLSGAEQIQGTAHQNTTLAGKVAQTAHVSVEVSKTGQAAVQSTITAMKAIVEQVQSIVDHILALTNHTQQINDIILGIKEIGDRSKYLSLNARIEAANAGDKGRGFSVVAHEMQNLAKQSAEATVLIRENLSKIKEATNAAMQEALQGKENVEQGMELVLKAGVTIQELAAVIENAAQISTEIEIATEQQSAKVEELVDNIRALTQSETEG